MAVTNTNGRARKSLADQIDRLDQILNGLSDGLNQAVAEAVRLALTEVLSGPLAEAIRQAAEAAVQDTLVRPKGPGVVPPATVPRPGLLDRLAARVRPVVHRAREAVVAAVRWVRARIRTPVTAVRAAVRVGCARVLATAVLAAAVAAQAWRFRRDCGLALLAGTVVGLSCFLAGPLISALVCGAAGAVLALAGMVVLPLVRLVGRLDGLRT